MGIPGMALDSPRLAISLAEKQMRDKNTFTGVDAFVVPEGRGPYGSSKWMIRRAPWAVAAGKSGCAESTLVVFRSGVDGNAKGASTSSNPQVTR